MHQFPITLITDTPVEVCGNKLNTKPRKKKTQSKPPKLPGVKSSMKTLPGLPTPPTDARAKLVNTPAVHMPPSTSAINGTVLKWIHHRGFGFIKPDLEYDQEYFVHYKNILGGNTLEKGKAVTFELTTRRMKDGTLKPAAYKVQGEAVSQQEFIPREQQRQRSGSFRGRGSGCRGSRGRGRGGPNQHMHFPHHYGRGGPMCPPPMWYGGSFHQEQGGMQFPMHIGGGFLPEMPYRAPGTDSYYAHQSLLQQPTHDTEGQVTEALRQLSLSSAQPRPSTSSGQRRPSVSSGHENAQSTGPGYPEYAPNNPAAAPAGYYEENLPAGSIPPGSGVQMMHPGPHDGYYGNTSSGPGSMEYGPGVQQLVSAGTPEIYHYGGWS